MSERLGASAVLFAFICTCSAPASEAQTESISVHDPRPLAKAIDTLEHQYGWIVTYEDPRYENVADVSDVTDTVRNPAAVQSKRRVLVPRGGSFSFSYERPASDSGLPQIGSLLTGLLEAYNAAGYAGRFHATIGVDRLFVTPVSVRAANGSSISQSSILDTAISMPFRKEISVYDALKELAIAVQQSTGHKVIVGNVPLSLLANSRMELDAKNELARDVLVRILQATRMGLSWRLFYDPGLQLYALNVHVVNR